MRIGIDIRTLMDTHYSGVAEYVLHLLHAIFKLEQENQRQENQQQQDDQKQVEFNQYYLFYNSAHDLSATMPKFDYPNVQVIGRRYPNKLLNYGLLKMLRRPKVNKLFNQDLDVFWMPHLNFIATEKNNNKSKSTANKQTKNILTVHDLSFLRYPKFFSWRKNIWHKLINPKQLVKQFDIIVAISENTKRDLIELCNVPEEKILVILSAIDEQYKVLAENDLKLKRVQQKFNLPDRFVLYLGTIEPRKNIESLIIAYEDFRHQHQNYTNIKLVVAGGRGWKSKPIYKKIAQSKYKDDIILTGYVDNQDKVALYNLAEVLVYPSFYEGFGFQPLEAMACGAPVICSFSSSLPEVVGNAAILIDPYNSTQITQALEQVLLDTELKNSLIAKGKEQAAKFGWNEVAGEYLELFK
jgi:glycosyltransferase involved in cell wall biosynthesis